MEVSKTQINVKLTHSDIVQAIEEFVRQRCGVPSRNIDSIDTLLDGKGTSAGLDIDAKVTVDVKFENTRSAAHPAAFTPQGQEFFSPPPPNVDISLNATDPEEYWKNNTRPVSPQDPKFR